MRTLLGVSINHTDYCSCNEWFTVPYMSVSKLHCNSSVSFVDLPLFFTFHGTWLTVSFFSLVWGSLRLAPTKQHSYTPTSRKPVTCFQAHPCGGRQPQPHDHEVETHTRTHWHTHIQTTTLTSYNLIISKHFTYSTIRLHPSQHHNNMYSICVSRLLPELVQDQSILPSLAVMFDGYQTLLTGH